MDPKNAARDYLLAAERYIKDSQFEEARREVKKAQELDPSNVYTFAFLERIEFFRQQKDKSNGDSASQYLSTDTSPEAEEVVEQIVGIPIHHQDESEIISNNRETGDENSNFVTEEMKEEITEDEEDLKKEEKEFEPPVRSGISFQLDDLSPPRQVSEPSKESELSELKEKVESLSRLFSDRELPQDRSNDLSYRLKSLEEKIEHVAAHTKPTGESESPAYLIKVGEIERTIQELSRSFQESATELKNKLRREEESIWQQLDEFSDKYKSLETRINEFTPGTPDSSVMKGSRDLIDRFTQLEKRVNDYSVSLQSEIVSGELLDDLSSKVEEIQQRLTDFAAPTTPETTDTSVQDELTQRLDTLAEQVEALSGGIEQPDSGDKLRTNYTELEGKFNVLSALVTESRKAVERAEDIGPQITALDERLLSLQETVTSVHERTHRVEGFTASLEDLHRQILEGTKLLREEIDTYRKEQQRLAEDLRSAHEQSGEYRQTVSSLEELKRQFEELTQAFGETKTAGITKDEYNTLFAGIEDRFADIDRTIRSQGENLQGFGDIDKKIESLANGMVHLTDELNKEKDARAGSTSPEQRFAALESNIAELKRSLDTQSAMFSRQEGLEREYQGLLTRISELQNTIETERSARIDIGEIDRKFSTIHERITPLQNALSAQTELHSKHTDFQSGLAELTERMSSLKEEIQSERSSFVKAGGFDNKLTLLEQRIKQEMESVLSSSAKFEEFENKFVQLEQRISELHSAFVFESEIHERIAALETAQTGHTQNIKDLEKLVGEELQKATDPARLESHFTHLHQQLDTVYEKLRFEEKHRREIDSLKDKITVLSDTHEGLKKFTDNEHTTRIDNENAASSRFDEFEKKITSIAGILEKMELFASERSRLNDRQYDELVNQIDDLHVSVDRERKSREAFVQLEQRFEEAHLRFDEDRRRFEAKLSEMTHIISGLQTSIDQERRERELLKERQVEVAKRHFIGVLEKGWVNGKPSGEDALEIQRLAELFSVPDETLVQLERDIKRKMYTRAAKAAISDQKIIKDPAFSLEGLRSRYGVTMEEYVEFESNFLHELISQQFSGTVMLVSGNTAFREELRQKLTSAGFAVVIAAAPDIALEKIEIINPQLIISETEFPTMQVSGLNLLNVLRKNKRFAHLPFILLSGPDELPRVQAAIYRPNESVLTKPIVFNTLLSVMNIQLIRLREHITSQSL